MSRLRTGLILLLVTTGTHATPLSAAEARPRAAPSPPAGLSHVDDGLLLRPCDRGVCFVDAHERTAHWVKEGRFYSEAIRERQTRFNAWLDRRRRDLAGLPVRFAAAPSAQRDWSARSLVLPERILETGRWDVDTMAIPYYRSVVDLLVEADAFAKDCHRDYPASEASREDPCASLHLREPGRGPARSRPGVPASLEAAFRLRAAMLQRAFEESASYGRLLEAAVRSRHRKGRADADGFDPEEITTEAAEALEAADLRLAGAVAQLRWAAEAYRGSAERGHAPR
jgi:hypothetical protein